MDYTPTPALFGRSDPAAILTTTRWLSQSSVSTKPNWSASEVHGAHSSSSSWRLRAGSSGTTSAASTAPSGTFRQRSSSRLTIGSTRCQPWR